ncbi:MAG: sulfatase-like hydrolase/transferase [Planctomycetia bacterium]|nr:sulfatase-like hydrolase/transferase [Planctomycetia bacterium]
MLLSRKLAILAAAITVATLCQSLSAQTRKPNVIVILADDLGFSDLGVQGGKDIPTPNIDSIAKSGVRCTQAYVSCPYCSPTRAGLNTGRYQTRFGHEFNEPAQPQRARSATRPISAPRTLSIRAKARTFNPSTMTTSIRPMNTPSGPSNLLPLTRASPSCFTFPSTRSTRRPKRRKNTWTAFHRSPIRRERRTPRSSRPWTTPLAGC